MTTMGLVVSGRWTDGRAPVRSVRSVATLLEGRENCGQGYVAPVTRVNKSLELKQLRDLMVQDSHGPLNAYIVPMDDEHQSEYVSEHDKRLQFISGFSGSAGKVVVTTEYAALWTDGRYYLQAEQELDCNWILMKRDEYYTPSVPEWLKDVLPTQGKVGSDPAVLSYDKWTKLKQSFIGGAKELSLIEVDNLVDQMWPVDQRPPKPVSDILVHNISFSGASWEDKVARVRSEMRSRQVGAVVINYLDESAWLYNLRGQDVDFSPVFFSYSIIELDTTSLYMLNVTDRLQDPVLRQHLGLSGPSNSCSNSSCVQVFEYGDFYSDLANLTHIVEGLVWVSPMSSYKIASTVINIDPLKLHKESSIVRVMKGRKNPTEIEGMRRSQKRDSSALIAFVAMLEKSVKDGEYWTEVSAAAELEKYRRREKYNRGLSFEAISASGPNGAVIHYRPSTLTDREVTTKEMYLLDSGAQYLDGTTDVTRTFHFGTPTAMQKEVYTRVLMGAINLALAHWPNGTYGGDVDILARQPLWSVGLQYKHGTGHGLGHFLNVHEGPGKINLGYRSYETPLYGEMFFSDEPGYYEEGEFGVRLETIVMTKKVQTKYEFGGVDWLGFEAFTLVPFEPNLINYDWLNIDQRKWLNVYNERCMKEIGDEIFKPANKMEAYEWLLARTQHIAEKAHYADDPTINGVSAVLGHTLSVMICVAHLLFWLY